MPLFVTNRRITIIHPIFGSDPILEHLEPMSIELLLWLRYKHDAYEMAQEEQFTERVQNWSKRYFDSEETNDWNQRCLIASSKYYKPPFSTDLGDLTAFGLEAAGTAKSLIMNHTADLVRKPTGTTEDGETDKVLQHSLKVEDWVRSDQVFTSVSITTRQATMLRTIRDAVIDAEETNRRELDERFLVDLKTTLDQQKLITKTLSAMQQDADNARKVREDEEMGNLDKNTNIGETSEKLYVPPPMPQFFDMLRRAGEEEQVQPMQAIALYGTDGHRHGFVPTSIFGDKARNDVRILVKYGLVDLKLYMTGSRGRPKNIVRVSPPGLVVVDDLTKHKVI